MTRSYEDAYTQKRVIEILSKVTIQYLAEMDADNTVLLKFVQCTAQKIMTQVADRERKDRCWYCYATTALGTERDTGLTQCLTCAQYTGT